MSKTIRRKPKFPRVPRINQTGGAHRGTKKDAQEDTHVCSLGCGTPVNFKGDICEICVWKDEFIDDYEDWG